MFNKNQIKNFIFSAVALFLGVFLSAPIQGQDLLDPVKWNYKVNYLEKNEVEVVFTARIEGDWHMYSTTLEYGSGPVPTSFNFEESTDYKLTGKVKEPKPKTEFDPNFNTTVKYFGGFVTFKQKLKVLSSNAFKIKGYLEYMVCNDETCLPPKAIDFEFDIIPEKLVKNSNNETEEVSNSETLAIDYTEIDEVDSTQVQVSEEFLEEEADSTTNAANIIQVNASVSEDTEEEQSLLGLFIFSFLGGLAALLTPCVFPMIPLTVSFFTKRSPTKAKGISNAIIYGLSIMVLYVGVTYTITRLAGPAAMNAFSTNPYVNLAFFVLLIVFAISFFGAFEITLPSSWVNKADKASERGGLIGIFFMAFTLALVSFSCTGPIIGTLLFEAFKGGIKGPLVGMTGFSLALAIPFALFAAFPGWMNSLPKSGGWLNSVKVMLGFIGLALAMKFLSTADLVWQAGILKREYFILIWIAIGILMTLYLLGKFMLPHDSKMERVGVFRLLLAVVTLSFTLYLIPGLWGAPLKIISGLTPPMWYTEAPLGTATTAAASNETIPLGADPEHCPHNLNCFHDFETGLAYAKKVNKPILIDFTGWGCVNCRKMEEKVWSDARVLSILRNEVVLISLYVDERKPLDADKQYYSEVLGQKVRNVGNYWAEFQAIHYKTNSQPYYVFVGHDSMEPLVQPEAYNPDVEQYLKWLTSGVKAFSK